MLRFCLALLPLLATVSAPLADSDPPWLHVEVSMAEDGFMCPFLTPLFVEILEDKGAEWVICRPQQSKVLFCVGLDDARDQQGYTEWLLDLGYQEEHISFGVFDTLSVLPPIPAP